MGIHSPLWYVSLVLVSWTFLYMYRKNPGHGHQRLRHLRVLLLRLEEVLQRRGLWAVLGALAAVLKDWLFNPMRIAFGSIKLQTLRLETSDSKGLFVVVMFRTLGSWVFKSRISMPERLGEVS